MIERPDGPPLLAAAGNDSTIEIWDLKAQAPHGTPLTGHNGWIWSLTALHGGPSGHPWLASASADHTIRLWDPVSGRPLGSPLIGHLDQVRAVTTATSDDGQTVLVSGGHDGTVRLWLPSNGLPITVIPIGIPIHALLRNKPDRYSRERTSGGATITIGLRTGILVLDLHRDLFRYAPLVTGAGRHPRRTPDAGMPGQWAPTSRSS